MQRKGEIAENVEATSAMRLVALVAMLLACCHPTSAVAVDPVAVAVAFAVAVAVP